MNEYIQYCLSLIIETVDPIIPPTAIVSPISVISIQFTRDAYSRNFRVI